MTKKKVAILGGGRLAEVVGGVLARTARHDVVVWSRSEARRAHLRAALPFPVAPDVPSAARDAAIVVFAVPVDALPEVAALYGPVARGDQVIVHGHRGTGPGFELPHALLRREVCVRKIVALGGPLHSRELRTERVLALQAACRFDAGHDALRALVEGTPVRVHATRDVVGVEVAGAIANVTAIACGMSDALGLGDTARGLLMMRGLIDAQRIGVTLGADPATFLGIVGLGELVPRKVSSVERHVRLGAELASGTPLAAASTPHEGAIEGVTTALAFAGWVGPPRPPRASLVTAVARVLRGEQAALAAIEGLLATDLDDPIMPRVRAEARG